MSVSANLAKQQLLTGLEHGFPLPHDLLKLPAPGSKVRNSAVLVLFGALDSVLATASAQDQLGSLGSLNSPGSLGSLDPGNPLDSLNSRNSLGSLDSPGSRDSRGSLNPLEAVPAIPGSSNPAPSRIAPELDVLLLRRSDELRNHAGQIAFPGGGVELGDRGRAATALREAQEETGLDPNGVDVLGMLPDAHIPVSNYQVTPVIGWWRLPSEVAADTQESVEVFRVPVAELLDPNARGTSQLTFRGRSVRGPAFQLGPQFGGHIVWGFTAIMLASIFDGVNWTRPWDEERTFEVTR